MNSLVSNSKAQQALRRRRSRGQAMVEYSIVTHALLLIGGTTMMGISQYLRLFEGIDVYLKSVYFVLQTAAV